MGAEQSAPAGESAFAALHAALPEEAVAQMAALAERDNDTLLLPHPQAPVPNPMVPVGVVVKLDRASAMDALDLVPRLQRKHYELVRPSGLDEQDFWVNVRSLALAMVKREHI